MNGTDLGTDLDPAAPVPPGGSVPDRRRRLPTRRAVIVGVVVAAAAAVVVSGTSELYRQGRHDAAAAASTVAGAVDPYSCRLGVAARIDATHSRDDAVQTVALDCPGQPLLHLPGPYGPEDVLPAGLFRVPGWQVQGLRYVAGEVRLWMLDEQQSCLLRMDVPGIESSATRVTCNLRHLPAPAAPTPVPTRPARPSATPTGRAA